MGDELLKKQLETEYLHLQKTIEDFDNRSLLIKGWGVTFSLVQIGLSLYYKAPVLCLIAAIAALLFWALEASWKGFQYAYGGRIREIETYFSDQSPDKTIAAFQITNSWYKTFHSEVAGRFFEFARWPHVLMPHAVAVLLGIIMFFLHPNAHCITP